MKSERRHLSEAHGLPSSPVFRMASAPVSQLETAMPRPVQSKVDQITKNHRFPEDSMSSSVAQPVDKARRTWIMTTCAVGGAGAAATAVPFVSSFTPSERAKAAGAAVEVDISALKAGEKLTVEWRGKPVWIIKRTPEQLATLKKTAADLADPDSKRKADEVTPMKECRNEHRSIKPEVFVAVGICSHLGCSPSDKFATGAQPSLGNDWQGGFLCPCHGSTFDMAGRVFKNKPAPDNLEIPPHVYLSDTVLLIGQTTKPA
jgi:ubiquinol-cytochrome c reductase iron-sulfur subunit